MAKQKTQETMPASPPSAYGTVKTVKDVSIIMELLGKQFYYKLEMEALTALFPECPELSIVFPVLSFNTAERAKLTFYETLDFGKVSDDETPEVRSWGRKLPEDGGELYRKAAVRMRWN